MTRLRNAATSFVALTFVLLLVAAAGPAAAASATITPGSGGAPNPGMPVKVHQTSWNASTMGDLQYQNNNGTVVTFDGHFNRTAHPNPFQVVATNWQVSDFNKFPHQNASKSVFNASQWSTTNATISEVNPVTNVKGFKYASGAGTNPSATYSNIGINSGAQYKYLDLAANVASASGTPTLNVYDTDGDYVTIELYNATANATAKTVLANATGNGDVLQQQIGSLTVHGTGDGVMTGIDHVTISGQFTGTFTLFNLDKTGRYQFGQKNDGTAIYEPHGTYNVTSLSAGFSSAFSDATLHGFDFYVVKNPTVEKATIGADSNYPNWNSVANLYYEVKLPSAYALSYSNAQLTGEQMWASNRYAVFQYKEGVTASNVSNITGWTDLSSTLGQKGDVLTLDSTVQPGSTYVVHFKILLTSSEAKSMQGTGVATTGGSGGAGGILGGSGSFWTSSLGIALIAVGLLAVGYYLLRRRSHKKRGWTSDL